MADLCTLYDVVRYMPGYDPDADDSVVTNETLAALITAQTVDIIERTGFEFVAISPVEDPRVFDVTPGVIQCRRLRIGAASEVATITQIRNGSIVQTFDPDGPNTILLPRVRQAWEPYTHLWFPKLSFSPALLVDEDTFEVSATWGFPSVPADIKEACAKLVIVRYLTDIAHGGTAFADAATGDINVGGLFASGESTVRRYQVP